MPNYNPNPKHIYTVEIVPAIVTHETYTIFAEYQKKIHNESDSTMSGYSGFLCDSPLYDPNNPDDVKRLVPLDDTKRKKVDQGVWPKYFGSYHMYHKIDGKIIAVGVLDFTPSVLSSVYFFYDPAYKFLNLGIVGALREIEYVQKIQESHCPTFKWYYLGYYIQDCIKSVYKGGYQPSYLLCPETFTWQELDKVREKITKSGGYTRLAEAGVEVVEEMRISAAEIKKIEDEIILLTKEDVVSFNDLNKTWKKVLEEIIRKLGKKPLEHFAWTA